MPNARFPHPFIGSTSPGHNFGTVIHRMISDLFFNCVTVKTLYKHVLRLEIVT